jgi:hypothetical protein
MSQIAVIAVKVVGDAPVSRQGDIDASPKPDPSATKSTEADIAMNAPAIIAVHDTADTEDSFVMALPTT